MFGVHNTASSRIFLFQFINEICTSFETSTSCLSVPVWSQIKPIKVLGQGGPNPPKVGIILEELGLPYEVVPVPLSDVKKPEYVAINPNGRSPAIYDPNSDITLWKSGIVIEYLIELYDTECRLGFAPGTPESYHAEQWLYFQATGQGPYYGQSVWFKKFHSEQVPSAIERYTQKVSRVSGVLDGYLAQQKQEHGGNPGNEDHGPWVINFPMRILRSSRGRELSVWCSRSMSTKRIISHMYRSDLAR